MQQLKGVQSRVTGIWQGALCLSAQVRVAILVTCKAVRGIYYYILLCATHITDK